MERQNRIPFHKELLAAVEPVFKNEGFILATLKTTPPESLTFERRARQNKDFVQVIFHGGGFYPLNQIYVQARSGDIHLLRAEDLLADFTPSSPFGGWGYEDERGLQAVVAELVDLIENHLINWINHPTPIFKMPVLNREQMHKLRDDLVKSIEIEKQLAISFREADNIEEAKKFEFSVEEKQKRLSKINEELGL